MSDDLNEILKECAKLRGVYPDLMHRTLNEFNWFVRAVIWGELTHVVDGGKRIYERWHNVTPINDGDSLICYAKAFLEYCKEEYGEVK